MMMKKKTARDYKFIRLLGEGSFSSVYLAVDADLTSASIKALDGLQNESGVELESDPNDSDQSITPRSLTSTATIISARSKTVKKISKYAIKVCQKSYIKRQNKQSAIMREKEIMNILNQHPNKHFIRLYFTFQDIDRLYFVMTYAQNGELLTYMQENPLSLNSVRKYTLQLVSALEHLHRLGIVHRDLKPENILLNEIMDILITDFGSAQIYVEDNKDPKTSSDRRNSFVGTAQYVSPEMLKSRQATNKSDLWALGVIIFQMITNVMPFNASNEYLIYQKIQRLEYEYPEDFDQNARDLVSSLIKLEPIERLGSSDDLQNDGYISIRRHGFLCLDDDLANSEGSIISACETVNDPDLINVDKINPGLDEAQLLRLLTIG